jgi:hypothetical protein
VDHTSFPFGANFTGLTGAQIDTACLTVETEWSGIQELFQTVPNGAAKRTILEGYLVGWWLADLFPTKVQGVSGDGGMPLTSKSIGGVSISRKDLQMQPALKQLESNAFGVKALSMLKSAPEMFTLFGQGRSLGPSMPGSVTLPGTVI